MFESPSLTKIISNCRDYMADPAHFATYIRQMDDGSVCAIGAFERQVGYADGDAETHPLWENFASRMNAAARELYPDRCWGWIGDFTAVNNCDGHAAILSVFDLAARIE